MFKMLYRLSENQSSKLEICSTVIKEKNNIKEMVRVRIMVRVKAKKVGENVKHRPI